MGTDDWPCLLLSSVGRQEAVVPAGTTSARGKDPTVSSNEEMCIITGRSANLALSATAAIGLADRARKQQKP